MRKSAVTCCCSAIWHCNQIPEECDDQLDQQLFLARQGLRKLAEWLSDQGNDHSQRILSQKCSFDVLHIGDLEHRCLSAIVSEQQ